MPVYVWKGKNSYGEKRKGEVEAVDLTSSNRPGKKAKNFQPGCKGKAQGPLRKYCIF